MQIPDLTTVESPITISGCPGNASATATVEVHIVHTYIGDLVVTLIAPDGSSYVLHNRAGGSTDNIDQTYTVNLSTEPAQRHLEAARPGRRSRRRRPHRLLDPHPLARIRDRNTGFRASRTGWAEPPLHNSAAVLDEVESFGTLPRSMHAPARAGCSYSHKR